MSRSRTPGLLLLAGRSVKALHRQAIDALQHRFHPDPWVAALALQRIERVGAALRRVEASATRHAAAALVVDAAATDLRARLRQRDAARAARWAIRPPELLAQQAGRQLQVLGAQCNHRELLLNPIERVETALAALRELATELDQHAASGTLPVAHRGLRDHVLDAIASMSARVERVRALRAITPPELLLAMADREVDAVVETLDDDGVTPTAALAVQRRLLETELLVLHVALAFGTPDTIATLGRLQRVRRRAGHQARPALRPSPSPAEGGG